MIEPNKQPDTVRTPHRKRRGLLWWMCAALALPLLAASPAQAQLPVATPVAETAGTGQRIEAHLEQFVVLTDAKGKEELRPAESVKPGDVIEYRVRYSNLSGKTVSGFVATLPLPEQLEYLPASAKPGANLVQAATADGRYAPEPLMRTAPNGKSEPVPRSEYRSLRWSIGQLPANAVTEVAARARVVLPAQTRTSSNTSQAPPARVNWVLPATATAKP